MSQNLSVLVTSGLDELSAEGRDKGDPVVTAHRSAIHAYAFFLSCIHESCHARALDSQKAEATAKGGVPKKRGGKAKAAATEDAGDSIAAVWPGAAERIMKALSRTLKANLDDVLYRTPVDKCRLVEVCVLTAARCMEDSSITKRKGALSACMEVVALSTARHGNASGCLDITAEAVFRLVKEHEHGPDFAIQSAALSANQHDSLLLGKALVTKFCELEPEEYDEIAGRDTKPVKRAAEMLSGMAVNMPTILHSGISQLMPYFGCKTAVTIRSNLVECLGHLMEWYMARGMDEKGSRQLQISRQNVVQALVSRVNDMAALVRKAALNNIERLASIKCWPLEYTVVAAKVAVARLDDGSLAAGAALSLLCTLALATPTEKLNDEFLEKTRKHYEEQLKGMKPDVVDEGADGDGQDAGPQWEVGALGEEQAGQQQQQPDGGERLMPATEAGIVQPTQLDDAAVAPTQAAGQANDGGGGGAGSGMTYSQLRLFVASLKELLELSRTLAAALPEVEALLASDSADVAEKAIQLLTLCSQKQLQGVQESWRRVWHLVFSTSEKVRQTVLLALYNFILPGGNATGLASQEQHRIMLSKLVRMVDKLSLCDLEALEELMRLAVTGQSPSESPMLGPEIVRLMLRSLHEKVGHAAMADKQGEESRAAAGQLSLLCGMVARHAPQLVAPDMKHLVEDILRSHVILKDAFLVRNLALMLRDIAPALHASARGSSRDAGGYQPAAHIPNALTNLLSVLVSVHLPEGGGSWPPAAQAALAAIYKLHPEPHKLLMPLTQHLAAELADGRAPASHLSRAVFLVGCIATQQLALIDSLAKRVRQERVAQEKEAAEQANADDMNAQLGTGQAREHQLDALQEELESKIMEGASLVGMWGKLVSGLCHTPALLAVDADLASAAMTTLAKLMALDAAYCEENCSVFFTRLRGGNVKLAPGVRCSMLVALGDLGRRHPNIVEPWTEHMFVCLSDENEEVAKTCLRILAHLILSDMTKPKGHMAHVARCLVSPSAALRDLAVRLFNSLSSKQAKGGANKVYQYLPEIISAVTRGEPMAEQDFKAMMQRLLSYVKVDKLADSLKTRLCERFENVVCEFATNAAVPPPADAAAAAAPEAGAGPGPGGVRGSSSYEEVVREWRSLADCIALIPYSEKGLRNCMEHFKCYKHVLGDEHVYQVFKGLAEHGRRGNRTAELKQDVADYEARLLEAHTSLREEQLQQAAAAAAAKAAEAAAQAAADAATQAAEGGAGAGMQQPDGAEEEEEEGEEDGTQRRPVRTPPSAGAADGVNDAIMSGTGENGAHGRSDGATADSADEDGVDGGDVGYDDMARASEEGDEGAAAGEEAGEDSGSISEPGEEAVQGEAGEDDEGEEEEVEGQAGEDNGEEDEQSAPADDDVDMEEWDENGAEGTPRRPLARGAGAGVGDDDDDVTASPGSAGYASGTPMAITPAPPGFTGAEQNSPRDDMAWSPGPSCAAAAGAAAGPAAGPVLQENMKPAAFPGFRIKPDPDGPQPGLQGAAWPLGGVVGVHVKQDPDGPWH
ncbi:hypothetical protein PLESTB_001123300 [Pleodorina starrii]|uniref:Condensin complex subunit 1 n=1 Tax=Pleodorina starrii TaxID=330485 RepID=A0A9W6F5N4_9CHLO|nr:hypothetical protein PLESTB_001123300 [Pleodorina starrii]GLC76171.1 hypothetical protein PLESTF_001745700 [Pleodorina starrii]